MKKSSRRTFIRQAAVAGAGFVIVPRHVLGRGYVAPSDKLNIAGIGAGGKGESDLAEFAKSPHVNIVAMCDVDDRAAAKSRERFPKANYYKDFRKMLQAEKNNIDAVSISTPDHTHAVATMAAMAMGKHVYTQKPLTHDIYEARQLAEAARKYKVVTQMGNQGGSGDGVRKAKEMYDAGLIGEVIEAHAWTNRPVWPQGIPTPTGKHAVPKELDWDLWLGPAPYIDYNPAYVPFNWRGWWAFGTGALGDMACHIMDPIYRILPILYPDSAECSVSNVWKDMWAEGNYVDSAPPSSIIHLNYPRTDGKGKIKVSWYDGGLLPQLPEELLPGEPFGNWDGGVLLVGKKGKLLLDCYGANPRLLPTRLMKETKMPAEKIKRVPEGHYIQWVNACIAGYGKGVTSSPFEYAGPFTESILMGNLAIRSWMMLNPKRKGWEDKYVGRKKLLWDAENMKVTNFDEANEFVKRSYREGWSL
ncbi:MAG: oxidoreductase [Sphingobacteriales bacterium SCN 48-20]|uniref:Gfo/Idh/MocA family protein n=1 Tax=Terrimonas ferruginea TaxID=249 RepID=UPI0008699D5A|nr:Gfo/Idh/MocA family oxidoreductase [Terrimonas ferruginea]MBN8784345.1 Gfo/Idh/MocA family oxidoreductase [Terrimonas ferruginea]ODT92539.1 MAG: oxidoreductase [Sphingobacteriales bacterium SCN 48-20]OJW45868.1 MAG: oxidoreductase [Sphingobacteriales bacterium 48-107]